MFEVFWFCARARGILFFGHRFLKLCVTFSGTYVNMQSSDVKVFSVSVEVTCETFLSLIWNFFKRNCVCYAFFFFLTKNQKSTTSHIFRHYFEMSWLYLVVMSVRDLIIDKKQKNIWFKVFLFSELISSCEKMYSKMHYNVIRL